MGSLGREHRLRSHDVVVVGAGQAGLATSYHLTVRGIEHVVLEAGHVGESWRSRRWDSFTLVTPNAMTRLPGLSYRPAEPEVFLPRDEIVSMLQGYAAGFGAPVRGGVSVESLDRSAGEDGYVLETTDGPIRARAVVVAAGFHGRVNRPAFATRLPARIQQLGVTEYRRAESLPPGAVLVVGSAQSGCRIAEDLHDAGRVVYLSVGSAGRLPRRYRGRDTMLWTILAGRLELTEDVWPDPRGRFAPNAACSGTRGGHTLNLHRFSRDGIRLLGRLEGIDGETLAIAPDLHDQLRKVDRSAEIVCEQIDRLIEAEGLDAPPADPADPTNWDEHIGHEGFDVPLRGTLDLAAAGISTVIWATGFRPDLGWIRRPILDATGVPVHRDGITADPGLAFVGLKFQRKYGSDVLYGVGDDAAIVADHIADLLGVGPAVAS